MKPQPPIHRLLRARVVRRLLALAGVAAALPLAHPAPSVSAADLITTAPSDCTATFDPYAYTRAAASACMPTFPMTGETALPGGGTAENYTVDGDPVSILMPPPGFQPATATDAQLDEYGFPPRPADPTALDRWQTEMSGWTGAASAPAFLADGGGMFDTVYSSNWSGYAVTGSAGTFTHAEAWYIEPTFGSSVCVPTSEGTWAGIGGYFRNSTTLAQDGTAHSVARLGNHQAWYEIIPHNFVPVNLFGHPEWTFDASTRRLSGNRWRFFMHDSESGHTVALDVTSSLYDGRSAEAIAERPGASLSNFGVLTVSASEANGRGFDTYSPNGNRHGIHMTSDGSPTGRDLADPSSISSDGFFGITQHHCS